MIKLIKPGLTCVFLFALFNISLAQTRNITGTVSDSVGNPLAGVTVTVKNSKTVAFEGKCTDYSFPISSLTGNSTITDIWLQETTGGGGFAVYVDDIGLN